MSGNMTAAKDAGNACTANVPSDANKVTPTLFCDTCLNTIDSVPHSGYVLADLYDPQSPYFYLIDAGAEYTLRCYEILITQTDDGGLQITVNGTQ